MPFFTPPVFVSAIYQLRQTNCLKEVSLEKAVANPATGLRGTIPDVGARNARPHTRLHISQTGRAAPRRFARRHARRSQRRMSRGGNRTFYRLVSHRHSFQTATWI